jgi:hypothetical protein
MKDQEKIINEALTYALERGEGTTSETFTDEQLGLIHGFIDGYNEAKHEYKFKEDEVIQLMLSAFESGFKKYDIVDAGLEGKEAYEEVIWILKKFIRKKQNV